MNLRDLRYLVAVADHRHFGKAAAASHVSQPTLSAQIKKLEEYLGVKLIERHSRGVALTEVGRELVERARHVVKQSDEIVHLARDLRDPLAGNLSIGLIPTVGPYLLPRVSKLFRKQLPKLRLFLYEHQTATLVARVRGGDLDVGICALPITEEGLHSRALYREDFLVALPPRHPLATTSNLKLADLSGESWLLLEDGHCLRDQALEVCGRIDASENQDYRATSLETLRQMVGAGAGITLLPKLAASGPFAASHTVVLKPLPKPSPHRIVGAVWRKSTTRGKAIAAICDVIEQAIE